MIESEADRTRAAGQPDGSAVLVRRRDLGVLRIVGADAATYLQGQVSADVIALPCPGGCLTAWHDPKGRVISLLDLVRVGDKDFLALLPSDLLPRVLPRLRMFVLRSKVEIVEASKEFAITGIAGSNAAGMLAGAGLPAPPTPGMAAAAGSALLLRQPGSAGRWLLIEPADAHDMRVDRLLQAGAAESSPELWRAEEIRAGIPRI
jgi:folate-binding Fe-S cluster repair protein YgfZ